MAGKAEACPVLFKKIEELGAPARTFAALLPVIRQYQGSAAHRELHFRENHGRTAGAPDRFVIGTHAGRCIWSGIL